MGHLAALVALLLLLSPLATATGTLPTAVHPLSQFSRGALQPPRPAPAVRSSYTLVQELSAWSDLTVLLRLLTVFPDLVATASSAEPLLVFAPTNAAFLAVGKALLRTPDDADPETIAEDIVKIFQALADSLADPPSAKDVLTYHLVPGDLPEHAIRAEGSLTTVFGEALSTADYPTKVGDVDPGFQSSRLGRQVRASNGRVSIINNVLLPFDLARILADNDITPPLTNRMADAPDPVRLFTPLRSLLKFITSRNDLTVLATLAAGSDLLKDVLSKSQSLRVFAPTDRAFLNLAQALLPEGSALDLLPEQGEAALGNAEEITKFAERLASTWALLDGVPTLEQIVAYHVINTTKSFDDLSGQGPQQTLFGGDATIQVLKTKVRDNDPDRGNAPLIASFATRNGFVSIVDDVLLPFPASTAIEAVNMALGTDEPQPSASVEITETPDADDDDGPVCFPAHATVRLYDGSTKRMDQLDAGDSIAVSGDVHSPVYLFTHRLHERAAKFVNIETDCGRAVTMTSSHYLYANAKLTSAGAVQVGETLETDSGLCRVVKVTTVVERGLFAPHTMHGDLVVDGVRVSSYSTAVEPRFAHWGLSVVRLFVKMGIKEPLKGWFNEGAPRLAAILPKGCQRY